MRVRCAVSASLQKAYFALTACVAHVLCANCASTLRSPRVFRAFAARLEFGGCAFTALLLRARCVYSLLAAFTAFCCVSKVWRPRAYRVLTFTVRLLRVLRVCCEFAMRLQRTRRVVAVRWLRVRCVLPVNLQRVYCVFCVYTAWWLLVPRGRWSNILRRPQLPSGF